MSWFLVLLLLAFIAGYAGVSYQHSRQNMTVAQRRRQREQARQEQYIRDLKGAHHNRS